MKCRFCATSLVDHGVGADSADHVFLDLGTAPPSNAFLAIEDLAKPETWFPLKLYTCPQCLLVQIDEVQSHERLFAPDYAYFSSYSRSWLAHAERYVAAAVERLGLGAGSLVVEIASNDGYLLQHVAAHGIPCVGIEPTTNTAQIARGKGIETLIEFFGRDTARYFAAQRRRADLIVANNVLAHVPDVNDFVAGISILLAPEGVVTVEFPHLMQLVALRQFDTVYHEHFSYFSYHTVQKIFAANGLRIWDVEQLATHGGSLRIWACHAATQRPETSAVAKLLATEAAAGMLNPGYYKGFQAAANQVKDDFLEFLIDSKRGHQSVAGYGAAAKGNTLLNYAGIKSDLLPFVVDASPHKQGRFLPGSHIPVLAESVIRETRPDFVVILPWNLSGEIREQLQYIREWGGNFVTAVPQMEIL